DTQATSPSIPKNSFFMIGLNEGKELNCRCSLQIVFPPRREDVDDQRFFERGSAMFHSAAHDERVARSNLERFSFASDLQMAMDDVDDLIVQMAVHCAHPALHHFVLSEK